MKRVSYIFTCVCAFLIGMCAHVYAQAPGAECRTAIPMGDNFNEPIYGPFPKSVWYTAWTFDLPLTVQFVPNNPNDPAPLVEMDFTCTPGVYTDSILCSLFCRTLSGTGLDVDIPHKPTLSSKTENGQTIYYLAMGMSYRDLLYQAGVTGNVQVFVKVTYNSGGVISLVPDGTFSNCMDGYKFMHIGDTVQVKANDKNRHVIVPYVQWQQDSIRYIWNGTAPCEVVVSGTCDFDPTNYGDDNVIEREFLQAIDTAKVTSKDMSDWVDFAPNQAGMYYAKFYTSGTGKMTIERIPPDPPQGGATLLRYDRATPVAANGINDLYAIPYSWATATKFTTLTDRIFKMYIGTTYDFTIENAIATYQFSKNENGHWLGLMDEQMQALWTQAIGQYLYVRFECSAKTTVKPVKWVNISECLTNVTPIDRPKSKVNVKKASWGATYCRFYYNDWKGGDMTFKWSTSASTCPTFIGDTCDFLANASNKHVIANKTIPKTGTRQWTFDAAEVAEWWEYVDPDGYLYIRFNPDEEGYMTISTTAEERDPICNPYDSILAVTAWDSYIWRGTTYASGGVYSEEGPVNAETGCIDTVYTLRLMILTTSYDNYAATDCDSVIYHGKAYTQSTAFNDTTYDTMGNRTITAVDLTVLQSVSVTLKDTAICETDFGFEYIWGDPILGDTTITDAGTYTRHFTAASGCDSAVTQTVHVLEMTYNLTPIAITAYDSYTTTLGVTYRQSRNGAPDYYTNAAGCDSIVTLNLTIRHLQERDTVVRSVCDSELPFTWYGKTYRESGLYSSDTIHGEAVNGVYMDTVHAVNLTVKPTYAVDTTADVLALEFVWHGTSYTQSGDYAYNGQTVAGCDSIVTLHLTLTDPTPIDTVPAYFCSKSGIVEHVDITSNPRIQYIQYDYEKPNKEWYMEGVVTGEINSGAYVDFIKAQQALYTYYVEPLTPVTVIYWRYRERGASSQTEVVINRTQPQWVETGTISIEVQFQCGQRYYDSFTVGNMTESTEQVSGEEQPIKRVEKGQVVIIRNGEKYTILGTKIQ